MLNATRVGEDSARVRNQTCHRFAAVIGAKSKIVSSSTAPSRTAASGRSVSTTWENWECSLHATPNTAYKRSHGTVIMSAQTSYLSVFSLGRLAVITMLLTRTIATYAQSANTATVPVTVVQRETFRDEFGKTISMEIVNAIRGDGYTVRVNRFTAPDGSTAENRSVADVNLGKRIAISGIAGAITTYPYPAAVSRKIREQALDGSCGADGSATQELLLGHKVAKTQRLREGLQITAWKAPGLSCLELKTEVSRPSSQGPVVMSSRETLSVKEGEPDAQLFSIPDYPEMSPSEVRRSVRQKSGLAAASSNPASDNRLDQAYHSQPNARK